MNNPFSKIALVLGAVVTVLGLFNNLLDSLAINFLGEVYAIPIDFLVNLCNNPSSNLFAWLSYMLALDWVVQFLRVLPKFIWWLIHILLVAGSSFVSWCVVNFFRDLVGRALNDTMP